MRTVIRVSLSFELWTDGACSGNPGPGGWAYILIARGADGAIVKERQGFGGDPATTNNRMELKAAIEGLRALVRPVAITIRPDSSYLEEAFTKRWLAGWQRKRACEVLDAHLNGGMPLQQVAAECGISTGHFSRAFRLSMGITPHAWLMRRCKLRAGASPWFQGKDREAREEELPTRARARWS